MGILAIQYKTLSDAPILLAVNREERYSRPALPPRIQSGRPRVVCGIDRATGGTWAGVNQYGLFVSALNAPKRAVPYDPRSRGLLCKELLSCHNANEAIERAESELLTGNYAGVNYLCVDHENGAVVYGGDSVEIELLRPGLHMLSSSRMDDRNDQRQEYVRRLLTLHRLDSPVAFLAAASGAFSRTTDVTGRRGVIVSELNFGTVSSMLLSLTERTQKSVMQFANGSPNETLYDDVSALLRQVLSTDRASHKKARASSNSDGESETSDIDSLDV